MVGICTALCCALILYRSWSQNVAHTRRMAADQARIAQDFNLAVRDYIAHHVRPFAQEHLDPGQFEPETMSTSFVSREVFEQVSEQFPGYILKFSSENPRNPKNQATPQERDVIRYFNEHPDAEEWRGLIEFDSARYQADFHARRMTPDCLHCHGEPSDAPPSLLARYGSEAGFHRHVGEVMAVDMVAVPVEGFESEAAQLTWQNAVAVTIGLALLLAAVFGAFHVLVRRRLAAIASHFHDSLEHSDPSRIAPIKIRANDEIGQLASDFNALVARLSDVYGSLEQRVAERTQELEAANRDLTHEAGERIQAQLQLSNALAKAESLNRVKSEFLANVSHEIRTPMTAILGFSENLLSPELSEGERKETIETIQRNGQHLLNVINDILDISKVEAGKMVLEAIPCRLDQILGEVLTSMRGRTDAESVRLQVRYDGLVPREVLTDPTRVRQILINLAGNAVKFTKRGRIEIAVRFREGNVSQLEFDVTDTGIGMTLEQTRSLFVPFTQGDTSMARRFGGTGLGLALSRRLAELLGGRLDLVRTEPGAGSCFRLTIPVSLAEEAEFTDSPDSSLATTFDPIAPTKATLPTPCRILLAEDGPDNQRLIRLILGKAGADVTVVENGEEAVKQILSNDGTSFDVILMDMQMPILDGYEATAQLREAGYEQPIIALTAHAMAHDRQKCLDAGCDEYTTKPIDRCALIRVIRNVILTHSASTNRQPESTKNATST